MSGGQSSTLALGKLESDLKGRMMTGVRKQIYRKLHETYTPRTFDNRDVWMGNLSVDLDGIRYGPTMARAYLGPNRTRVDAQVRAELYLRDVESKAIRARDIDVHLWTDVNDLGFIDERGVHHNGLGFYSPMYLLVDAEGVPELSGNNLVFASDVIRVERTGVFHYTVGFSADEKSDSDPSKAWLLVNDVTLNRDGLIVVSPEQIERCLSITEICVRKAGAKIQDGRFLSGMFRDVTRFLDESPTDVVYLLPFFEPGFKDLTTGKDVRKGKLGSVYAVKDFFKLDPLLVSPPEEADLLELASEGLIRDFDLSDLLDGRQQVRLRRVNDFNHFETFETLSDWVGRDRLVQLVGRAELRRLTRRAHELGKRVIFDLVLMQTSRDCPLIQTHPEWYVLDASGSPKIHQIAWLVYSDVALLDLQFNKPLQNYLSAVAPFWIQTCDLDGVRIDASQTVDRPFLKQIKNRINQVKDDAIVLGETLCDLQEAVDIPTDMIYALLVDFHRETEHASPLIDFLERTSGTFANRTVAVAYFENHDTPRGTRVWRERFASLLQEATELKRAWRERTGRADPALVMALLKNIQASLIDASAGSAIHVNLSYALELGTTWGEEKATDFEDPTLYHMDLSRGTPRLCLAAAYEAWHRVKPGLSEIREGRIYFHRNEFDGGDPDDQVLAYTRYTSDSWLLVVHNLDPRQTRRVTCELNHLQGKVGRPGNMEVLFDTYPYFFDGEPAPEVKTGGKGIKVSVSPLRTFLIRGSFSGLMNG